MLNSFLNPTAADCDGNGIWYEFWDKEIAWIIVLVVAFITAFSFISNSFLAKKHGAVSQQKVFIGFGLFVFGLALTRIMFIFSDIERWNNCFTPRFVQIVLISYTIGIFSALALLVVVERDLMQMKRTLISKFYFIMAIIALIFAFIANSISQEYLDRIRLFNTIINSAGGVLLVLLFFRIILASTGSIRKNAIMNFLGIILIMVGLIIDGDLIIRTLSIPIWFPAIFPFCGYLVIFINHFKSVKEQYVD